MGGYQSDIAKTTNLTNREQVLEILPNHLGSSIAMILFF